MAQKLDKILVVDVEATCWDGKLPAAQSLPTLSNNKK